MNIRNKVVVAGIPFTWSTNLSDDELREFYFLYADKIDKPVTPPKLSPIEMRIDVRFDFLEFLNGICRWFAKGDEHSVIYRTTHDWELYLAHRAEVEELREEHEAEETAEKMLRRAEDAHLREKANELLKAGDYDAAAAYVTACAELRLKFDCSRNAPPFFAAWHSELPWVFTQFPTSRHGIEFLLKYRAPQESYESFANWFTTRCGLQGDECVEQTRRIYEEGMRQFPDSVGLTKATCLFWRRVGRFDLAMQICAEAITKGMKDGTKSGFTGRLQRLEKESRRRAQ